ENWKRPKDEVSGLMQMLKRYLRSELKVDLENNIRLFAIGDIDGLPADVRDELGSAIKRSSANTGTMLNVALNYGGRAEIVRAANIAIREMAENGIAANDIELSEADIERNLYTRDT